MILMHLEITFIVVYCRQCLPSQFRDYKGYLYIVNTKLFPSWRVLYRKLCYIS